LTVEEHYRNLLQRDEQMLNSLVADPVALVEFVKAHNFQADFEKLRDAVTNRPESEIFSLAIREYDFALSAVACSHYRHAHISLRLFFELALSAIHFSAHEINLRKWMLNSHDIYWSALADKENGVFAKSFIQVFHPGLSNSADQYLAMAVKVYRECSEFVHGNLHTHQDFDQPVEYNQELQIAWAERAEAVRISLLFAFAGRYLALLNPGQRTELEQLMIESFGHLQSIQELYGK
jgi:hypothetical protein